MSGKCDRYHFNVSRLREECARFTVINPGNVGRDGGENEMAFLQNVVSVKETRAENKFPPDKDRAFQVIF